MLGWSVTPLPISTIVLGQLFPLCSADWAIIVPDFWLQNSQGNFSDHRLFFKTSYVTAIYISQFWGYKVLAYEHLLWNKAVSRLQFEWHHGFETTLVLSVDDYREVCCYRVESWPFLVALELYMHHNFRKVHHSEVINQTKFWKTRK